MTADRSYNVYVSASGNVFMAELAEMVADSLRTLGRDATIFNDGLPERSVGVVNLVVAPHEYFPLLRGYSVIDIDRAAAASICIGTEQPATPWFELSARYCAAGPLALDINAHAVEELRRRRLNAVRLPLGYYPGWDHWDGDEQRARPCDLLFLGALTPRREQFFAASAPLFWDHDCEFRFFEVSRPMTGASPEFVAGSAKYDLLAGSRILLNVHRGDLGYFEWLRILEAVANGCLVLTETSVGYEPLVPFDHFVLAPLQTLGHYAVAMLDDEALRTELAHDAYQFVKSKMAFVDMLERLLPTIEAANRPSEPRGWAGVRHAGLTRSRSRRRAGIATKDAQAPSGSAALLAAVLDTERSARVRIKELLLAETMVSRSIEAIQAALQTGSRDHHEFRCTSAYNALVPDVSVVLSLYNYDNYVGEAIDSVVNGAGVTAELIVVDDHSSDQSVSIVTRKMRDHDWFPMCLVAKSANQGLAAARNTGFELARAEFVFVLDADNLVFPSALTKLARALRRSDAAFAYGIIEKFGSERGLVSCLPWDVMHLTVGNYIDAMALVRRSAWRSIGGYDVSMDLLGGWEDYDFWLRLASEGQQGVLVPEILARYRAHGRSMLATLNLDPTPIVHEVRGKYPLLPWPVQ